MLKDFASSVSVCGMEKVCDDNTSNIKRTIWATLLLGATAFLFYHFHNRVSAFFSLPVMIDMKVPYVQRQKFPAITICNANAIRISVPEDGPNAHKRIIKHIYHGDNDTLAGIDLQNFNWRYFVAKTAHQIETMLMDCEWEGQECSWRNFTPVHTDQTYCYTFNAHEGIYATRTGMDNGLSMLFNVEYDHYPNGQELIGFRIAIHAPGDVPVMDTDSFCVGTGAITDIGIRLTRIENLRPPYGGCGEKDLRYFDRYSPSRCYIECLSNYTVLQCGCRYPYMVGTARICNPLSKEWQNCHEVTRSKHSEAIERCGCPTKCSEQTYKRLVTRTKIRHGPAERYNMSRDVWLNHVSRINIYFEEMKMTIIKNKPAYTWLACLSDIGTQPAYTWLACLSDIGGAMGVALGCCLMTVAQLLDFLGSLTVRWCSYQRRRRRQVRTEGEEGSRTTVPMPTTVSIRSHSSRGATRVANMTHLVDTERTGRKLAAHHVNLMKMQSMYKAKRALLAKEAANGLNEMDFNEEGTDGSSYDRDSWRTEAERGSDKNSEDFVTRQESPSSTRESKF